MILAKSQLRAGRSGRSGESLFQRASILAVIDAACFAICAVIGYFVAGLLLSLPASMEALVSKSLVEILVFIPAIVPSAVLVAGVLFELSVSSKFASSDSINWLPVTQAEYVTASTLSVAYDYSVVPSIMMGLTLVPALRFGYGWTWVEMLLLSSVSLVYGGAIVEILRAAINRVSSAVMGRARRGALVLRLAATVGLILVVEIIFNFVFLIDVIGSFTSSLSSVAFIPILWASLAVRAGEVGNTLENVAFAAGTFAFTAAMLWVAVRVRSRYWSPTPVQVRVTQREYAPTTSSSGLLRLFGLGEQEETLVRKDLKGITRRRELLQYFALPFVISIVFIFETFFSPATGSTASGAGSAFASQIGVWFAGGLFGLMISSISFGQEGKSAPLLYSLPLRPMQVLRAKMFISLTLALVATLGIFTVMTLLSRPPFVVAMENLAVAVAITVQEVCIGTAFGLRYPDFQERPRPRFVAPIGIIMMVFVGIAVLFATGLPALATESLASYPGLQSSVQPFFLLSIVFAVAVAALAYRWARRGVKRLFVEFQA